MRTLSTEVSAEVAGTRLAPHSLPAVARPSGHIGPNAVLQVLSVLEDRFGPETLKAVATAAGLAHLLDAPPAHMVDERWVRALFDAVLAHFDAAASQALLYEAGRRTGAYVLAHRIPKPVQRLLRRLPDPLAARALMMAIRANAWTYAGSGRVTCDLGLGQALAIHIHGNPIATPGCPWHVGAFEALFRTLVAGESRIAFQDTPQRSTFCVGIVGRGA